MQYSALPSKLRAPGPVLDSSPRPSHAAKSPLLPCRVKSSSSPTRMGIIRWKATSNTDNMFHVSVQWRATSLDNYRHHQPVWSNWQLRRLWNG